MTIDEASLLVNVGERTNVTGSARFADLIRADDYDAAVEVARDQVDNGAQIIDVNMDEGMLDGEAAMTRFLNLIAAEPDISRVPVMIDSSKWSVIEAGLKCVQGKPVINSISMKEGEAAFIAQARLARRYGAAVVVMAFDEEGQADTYERKVAICARAYEILTERSGLPPEDIIFDPNIFAVATGIEAHAEYGRAFIEATRTIRAELPHARVSGGLSNLSFSFRGNNPLREAMHTVFLYHAVQAGLGLVIVNAGRLPTFEDVPSDLRERIEDVLFNRRPDATERLIEVASDAQSSARAAAVDLSWRELPVAERLEHALVHGHRRVRRRGHRGGASGLQPRPRGDRGSAHGRHGRGRRSLRQWQDVPAPGGEERTRDEEGGGSPRAVHGGRRRSRPDCGQGGDGHGEGRRPRHRQEHRRGGAAVQQLRGHRSRRDGAHPPRSCRPPATSAPTSSASRGSSRPASTRWCGWPPISRPRVSTSRC